MSVAFYILAAVIAASGVGVVLMRNPIHSALCLITNLVGVAGVFALLGAHFLAVVQIIVYAGAIMVLVVFVIMLLNIKNEEVNFAGWGLLGMSLISGAVFLRMLWPLLKESFPNPIDLSAVPVGTVEAIGETLFTKYVFPFEAASILIMAGVVGAVMISRAGYSPSGRE